MITREIALEKKAVLTQVDLQKMEKKVLLEQIVNQKEQKQLLEKMEKKVLLEQIVNKKKQKQLLKANIIDVRRSFKITVENFEELLAKEKLETLSVLSQHIHAGKELAELQATKGA